MDRNKYELVKCNLCGKDNYMIVYRSKYEDESHEDLSNKFKSSGDETLIDQVVKCKNCGLIYINPRLRQELIIGGYCEGDDPDFASQAKGRERTFDKNLKFIHKILKKNNLKFPGKILDIGTANGSFLYAAKKRNWDVYGIEPNKWLCNWAKKNYDLDIKQGTLFNHKFKDNFFDVISLWDVLEHVPNPTKELQECCRILKKTGLLVINYPDIGSIPSKIMKRKWFFLLSVHLYYFNKKTIKKILEKNGLSVIAIKPHFQNLELGYLVKRSKAYSKLAHTIGEKFVNLTNLHSLKLWYWIGQTLVIAKKK